MNALKKDGSTVQRIKNVMAEVEDFELNNDGAIGYDKKHATTPADDTVIHSKMEQQP